MPKLRTMKQIMALKYTMLPDLPEVWVLFIGLLSAPFIAIIWGKSGQGKTNLLMLFLKMLAKYGSLLYVSLEEGHELTMRNTLDRHFSDTPELAANLRIADHHMTYQELRITLKKKRSPKFIVVDSIQYWNISYDDYKALKQDFPSKSFLFISHAKGKEPHGSTAAAIRYDAGIKIHVDGYMAFPVSRYGGNTPFVIWEEGAKRRWGVKQFKKFTSQAKAKA